jgi:hypothetical protein
MTNQDQNQEQRHRQSESQQTHICQKMADMGQLNPVSEVTLEQ